MTIAPTRGVGLPPEGSCTPQLRPRAEPSRAAPAGPSGSSRTAHLARNGRLEMYRSDARTPEFWDRLWDLDPPRPPGRAEKVSLWYRALFAKHLARDGLIVEAGCGNGNLMRTLTAAGYQVEGLDFAPRAIDASRRIDPEGRYRLGDVRDLPYSTGSLAGYLSFGVVEHFDDATRAGILAEAARVLRPGGIAVITTPYFSPIRQLRAQADGYQDDPRGLDFYQFYFTRCDLESQLRSAGLTPIAADGYDLYKGLKDTLGLKPWLDRWNRLGAKARRWLHHPPRAVRLAACHMLMVIAERPGPAPTQTRAGSATPYPPAWNPETPSSGSP